MTNLKLYLLGPPRLEVADQPVAVGRRKGLALLAYLAVTNRSSTVMPWLPSSGRMRPKAGRGVIYARSYQS